jgi:predicted NBD/HSP70 family sugar kinase
VKTRKQRKIEELKKLLLTRGSLTRAEASESAELDIRTVTAYFDELCSTGICRQNFEAPEGKGRPGIVYTLDEKNMLFLGIAITSGMNIRSSLTDIAGNVLDQQEFSLEAQSKLTIFNRLLVLVNNTREKFPDKKLGAIGVAISRWLQPPLAAYDLYSGLCDFLEKQTGVSVYRDININALAYKLSSLYGVKNLIVLHAGKVIELGLLKNGTTVKNHREHENTLSHLPVELQGPRCYCGKTGCLEHFVTEGALIERLKQLSATKDSPEKPINALEQDLPEINKLVDLTAEYLIEACEYLTETYDPEKIILLTSSPRITEMTVEKAGKHSRLMNIVHREERIVRIETGAAFMAAAKAVKQFIS